jgi:hypothetical protein
MTNGERNTVVGLSLLAAIILLWWYLRKRQGVTTQTSVKITGGGLNYQSNSLPQNQMGERLLRICTYDSGATLSLNPGAVGGDHCPPVYTDVAGKSGNLLKDEVITLPSTGTTVAASPDSLSY